MRTSSMAGIKIALRRLFRQTPPQTENGWNSLAKGLPAVDPRFPQGTIELYSVKDDSLCRAYIWSLPAILQDERALYYWRQHQLLDSTDRGLTYFLRSKSILG